MTDWYHIVNIEAIDSPSLVLYEDRLMHNLDQMIEMVGHDASKLMPHIKTNKMPEVIQRMIKLGLKQFKASTIAEAEMAATEGAESVLIAHQMVGPKIKRLAALAQKFPDSSFATIIDNSKSLADLQHAANTAKVVIGVYIDINNGMHRTGIEMGEELDQLIDHITDYKSLLFKGLHVYDGHLRNPDFELRSQNVAAAFEPLEELYENLKKERPTLELVCGGTPTFTTHLLDKDRICSPGTCVFWDWSYASKLKEQEFKFSVLLVTRIISKPTKGIITVDMGHKSVAAENPINQRIKFLNLDGYDLISQSEEHGVLTVNDWEALEVGDVLYGVPYHICPTINLYDEISVITNKYKTGEWKITGRQRKLTI